MTLAELLTASAVALTVAGGIVAAAAPAHGTFAARQESLDLQQRLRVAIETIAHDLRAAASVRPYRTGAVGDDGRAGLFYREGTITVRFAAPPAGAPAADPSRTYYLRASGDTAQLMRYDGQVSSFPVLDDVVALAFEYFGVPEPPAILVTGGEPARATYGPTPPAVGEDDPADAWGAGENCTFRATAGAHTSRLRVIAGTTLMALPAEDLMDGPWCPDAGATERFDADLLRVRRVRVRLRLQAPAAFRGAAGALFLHGGTATDGNRQVPDARLEFDIALRNWNASQ